MLFGLGSPSGIANAGLNSANLNKNAGKFETRVDMFGTFRNSLDYNYVLLPKELAIRVALLADNKKYRQEPSFEDDKRAYAALRYEPKFLAKNGMKTTLRANYEHGDIEGMRPRTLPPIDRMSAWFNADPIFAPANPQIGKPDATYYGLNRGVFNNWDMTSNDRRTVGVASPNYNPNVNTAAEGGRNWLNPTNPNSFTKTYTAGYVNNPYFQPFISEVYTGGAMGFYEGNGSTAVPYGMYVQANATGQYGINNSTNNGPKYKTSAVGVVEDGNVGYFRGSQWQAIAEPWKTYRYMQIPYGGLWRDPSMTNVNTFDFFNNSLDGDNRRHWRNFDTFNATLDQTFFNNRAGISVAYDQQKYEDGSHSIFNDRTQTITIDVNATYPNSNLPNPNAGRAIMMGDGNYNTSKRERSEFRATAFGELRATDFLKKGMLADILGRHILTGMVSKNDYTKEDRGYRRFMLNPSDLEGISKNLYTSGDPLSYRTQVYMSPDSLQNTTKYPNMGSLNLQPLQGIIAPQSVNFSYFDSHWVPSLTVGAPGYVNPTAAWTDPYSGATNSQQKNNPANYVGWRTKQVGVLDSTREADRKRMGTSLNIDESVVNSMAFVWQGFFFKGNLVPTFGYREDKKALYLFQSGSAGVPGQSGIYRPENIVVSSPGLSTTTLKANPGGVRTEDGFIIEGSPNIQLPATPRAYDEFVNRSWSIVGHAPQFVRQYLPWGTSISLSYNESTNFNPGQAGRVDIWGRPIPSTAGKTQDAGVLVSMLQNRVNFRILKYKSTVERESASGLNMSMMKEIETRAWVAAKKMEDAILASQTKDYLGNLLPGATPYVSSFENPNYLYGMVNPADTNQILYASQAQKDALLAQGRIDSSRVLANAPVDLFTAWNVDMVGSTWRSATDIGSLPAGVATTQDRVSEGWEYELTVMPLKNWRITGNFSTTEAVLDNNYLNMREVVFERTAIWAGPQGNFYYSNPGRQTAAYRDNWNTTVLSSMTSGIFADDLAVQEGVQKRGNLVTTYDFQKGFIKGFSIGGAYRWEEKAIIGNKYKTVPYTVTTGATSINYLFEVPDRNQPIYAPSQEAVDLWFSYAHKLTKTVNWKIQLNIYNAQGHTKLVPISTQPDGSYAQYRIKEGASWALTNTFSF
jgi:hypothetical protein